MNGLGFILTLIFSAMVMILPRRLAGLGVFAAMMYITQGQQIEILGFHFTTMRMVLLLGTLRGFASGWFRELEYNSIDRAVVVFVIVLAGVFMLRCRTTTILVYCMGMDYNILLSYFLSRVLVRDLAELEDFLKVILLGSIPFTLFLMEEGHTGHNLFAMFGGVGATDMYRDGHFRASGAFRSPITGGTYGATLLPIFLGLYLTGRRKAVAFWGMVLCICIVMSARSSGPLLASGCGAIGWALWKFRDSITKIRRGLYGGIFALHLYMKAPVWFLMGRISDLVGGGGYHRAEIVDAAVNHFSEWCWIGTDQTGEWMPTQLYNGAADLTNEFVGYAVLGGLASLILFIMVLVKAFRFLGLARKKLASVKSTEETVLWGLGCSLFATVINFFSVSYFDQSEVLWLFLLASCTSCSFSALNHTEDYAPVDEEQMALEKVEPEEVLVEVN